ncbi:aminopeptidase [marine bacterium AO1-C]|nr:aminopeptidase [marine bacterium AO1-C]
MKKILYIVLLGLFSTAAIAQNDKPYVSSKFAQLDQMLPTPNNYRTGSGAPGHEYWQQKADYKIKVALDEVKNTLTGSETITYYNYSPDKLEYLWVQLDQNRYKKGSQAYNMQNTRLGKGPTFGMLQLVVAEVSEWGCKIKNVKDKSGRAMKYTINGTMMRIDLPQPLKAKGGSVTFSIDWENKILDANKAGSRGGYEYFPKDGNYLYEIAQWFPRMCVYDDVNGWQNKQFLGSGEFALTFGDYEVAITAPADHIVGATGELQNASKVLSSTQMKRLKQAEKSNNPVLIVTQQEAETAEKSKSKKNKTWVFKAKNVRDFAWASSRKFIWDAMRVKVGNNNVWAMSYYPKEGNPLWGKYSTQVVAHTLRTYSKYTFDYPYPVAISVHGPIFGMEYPMICFNGGRPKADGTVPAGTRRAMISVIIHEVGHNYFPMIVNSDERQWTWMDEGLNSFMQYLSETEIPQQTWAKADYPNGTYPHRRGPAKNIVSYMRTDPTKIVPIMSNSESIPQFGNNAYGKPATALNILRETVMGKELFDHAFKTYSQRWYFKHPKPADFFRTMEDASGVDLDWFWRGWFYSTLPVDMSIEDVQALTFTKPDQKLEASKDGIKHEAFNNKQFAGIKERLSKGYGLNMSDAEMAMLKPGKYFYSVKCKNVGGTIMPLIIQANFVDGSSQIVRVPAEIFRKSPNQVYKGLIFDKQVKSFQLDPMLETADINTKNNAFPRAGAGSKFKKFKKEKKESKAGSQ